MLLLSCLCSSWFMHLGNADPVLLEVGLDIIRLRILVQPPDE